MLRDRIRLLAATAGFLVAAAGTGCGLGEGESSEGEATLTVTRDYGAETMLEATVGDPPESETVIRLLDGEAEISTRFGGGFVHSINGVEGELADGRSRDWFFYLNGIESSVGAAEVPVRGGDRVWWDYRDWTDALRTPAVVGSWPEPFAQAAVGADRLPVRVVCAGDPAPCDDAAERLGEAGVDASVEPFGREGRGEALRLVVGPWNEIRGDPTASLLAEEPSTSGVFARFERSGAGGIELVALDERAEEVESLDAGAGIVAGLRDGEEPATWVASGADAAGVDAAVEMLDQDSLTARYAVAVSGSREIALPAGGD